MMIEEVVARLGNLLLKSLCHPLPMLLSMNFDSPQMSE